MTQQPYETMARQIIEDVLEFDLDDYRLQRLSTFLEDAFAERLQASSGSLLSTPTADLAFDQLLATLDRLPIDFSERMEHDSELDQISQVHRFHQLHRKLISDKPFLDAEKVEEAREMFDEACSIQADLDEIVTVGWLTDLSQINEKIEDAEEVIAPYDDDEE